MQKTDKSAAVEDAEASEINGGGALEPVSTAIPSWAVRQIEATAQAEDRKFSWVLRRIIMNQLNPQS